MRISTRGTGQLALERADRRRVVRGAAIRDVVAIDRGHHDVRQPHLVRGLGEPERLERIRGLVGLPRVDVAVAARARAGVAQDLERRRPAPPALADVGAARLLADGDEVPFAHQSLHLVVAGVGARRPHLHPLGPAGPLGHGKRLLHRPTSLESVVPEAPLERAENGLAPVGEGWFVLNARDARWFESELGFYVQFESENARFDQVGIGLGILRPGEPGALYHGEDAQEDFLVLSGECRLLIEGEERLLKAWDFVHCPNWTEHIFVGAG